MQSSIRTVSIAFLAFFASSAVVRAQTLDDLTPALATLTATDGLPFDGFGRAVALSGDTLAVGVPSDAVGSNSAQGSVRIFVRTGGIWVPQATLTASDGAANDNFGLAVDLSGDTLVVGAPLDDVGTLVDQGSVRVFVRSGTTWTAQQTVTLTDGSGSDQFGGTLSLSGNTLAVGVPYDEIGANIDQGSVRVFTRSGTTWTAQQTLTASDGWAIDFFGARVALVGDTLAVGMPYDDVGSNNNQGSVRMFTRSGTTWTAQQTLTASDGVGLDYFGWSVALSNDTLAVAAAYDDVGGTVDQGSVHMFTRSGAVWTAQQTLTASDGGLTDFFGDYLDLSGDTLAVAVPYDDVGSNVNQGSVRIFTRTGGSWSAQAALTASDGSAADFFGQAAALAEGTLVVAVPFDDVGSNGDQGSVRMFGNYRVWNQTRSIGSPTLASAVGSAQAGDRLLVGNPAFAQADDVIDASQKPLTFVGLEPMTLGSTALLTVADNTVFQKSPDVASAGLTVAGKLTAPVAGTLSFSQLTVSSGGQLLQRGSTLLVNQNLATTSGGVCYMQGPILAEAVTTAVGSQNRCAGDTDVFANYTNAGSTVVQRGILYIYGTLTNTGTITGEVDTNFLPPSPGDGYSIGGDYVVSAESSIVLPDPVWWLRVGGNFDVAINASNRFVMDQATLELTGVGPGSLQSIEVLSRDLGAVDPGFATTNYPLGALRLRAGATVSLANNHNNAPGKGNEAIYTNELVVPAGATLTTNGLKVYTRTATIAGTVSNPNDIVVVPGTPPCVADIVTDGVVNGADLALVLTNWGSCPSSTCVADIDRDGTVGASDLSIVLASWGGCAN